MQTSIKHGESIFQCFLILKWLGVFFLHKLSKKLFSRVADVNSTLIFFCDHIYVYPCTRCVNSPLLFISIARFHWVIRKLKTCFLSSLPLAPSYIPDKRHICIMNIEINLLTKYTSFDLKQSLKPISNLAYKPHYILCTAKEILQKKHTGVMYESWIHKFISLMNEFKS